MSVGAPSRREGRERALSLLYEAEAKDVTLPALLDELPVPPTPFVTDLVVGVSRSQEKIDELIGRYAVDWSVERMAVIDRNVLRLAVYEILEHPDVPLAAVISEAVELAKRYSTEESGRFVNGVLSGVARDARPG
ncbi:MAG: transcription antitermination factor NusB [Actinomycetota bacterium]|nr:transcription antitermination factor NusB [Actinomycetota bacterium]MDQ3680118.1 transcription antitermination factor NusB [Actinomycetota bacterium]